MTRKRSPRWSAVWSGVTLCVCALTPVLPAAAEDWPQWRGLNRDGRSPETGLLQAWPESGPKALWTSQDVGLGYSTPSVVGSRLYVMGNEGMDNEFVQALNVESGGGLWRVKVGKVGENRGPNYPGSRSTPTVDGARLYALGSDGDLACLDASSGEVIWTKSLRSDFGGKPGNWAYAESPLVDGNAVVCTPGGSDATMVALNKTNGELIWKSALPEADEAGYASAIAVQAGGVKQYVQFMQKGLVGLDAATGRLLWRYGRTAQGSPANIPTPLEKDGFVYSAAGRSGGGLIQLKNSDGNVSVEEVYFSQKLPTAIGGAVLVGDFMYGTSSRSLLCVEFKTGDIKWEDGAVGAGSLCYADGRLYVHGESGERALVEASPAGYKETGRFKPSDLPDHGRSKAWAYPVVSNGRLFIRDLNMLWCYDVKAL